MRSGGIHWLAVIAAAIVTYAIGFVIYAVLIPMESWMAMTGMTEAEQATATSRMMFSPIMPILTAVFMAVLFKWGAVADAMKGAQWGLVVALASAVPTMLYGWVYGGLNTDMTVIDVSHLLLGHIAAGAILGGWK
jgi:Na+/melibiose symporter-like transporter